MPQGPRELFDDELLGLDPEDPEAVAFAEHLHRMREARPTYTVEGQLGGVARFADSANRATGHRRMTAVLLVGLILFGVVFTVLRAIAEMLAVFG
ncbi:hypothetical protein [Sciscionella marina]|uniref:hypothetical protein n=1 Tax=Sciscionella marina TaxID=508770 RepID=UPI000365654E|nr:hypothetical protein [Sciscionella marina]